LKNPVIKYALPAVLLLNCLYAQDITIKNEESVQLNEKPSLAGDERISIIKKQESLEKAKFADIFLSYQLSRPQSKKDAEEPFNIVSSFRSNVRFGGFWDKYAIINFTPQMQIRAFDFISFYAHHRISCFVPVNSVKQHFRPLAIQGAAVMAVETSLKFLMPGSSIIRSVIGFAAKNLIIYYMMKSARPNRTGENRMLEYDYYSYSLSIKF
jgi:hypothetical protein